MRKCMNRRMTASLPDLPIEVWSAIIVQLSFSDKVGVRGHQFYRAGSIFR